MRKYAILWIVQIILDVVLVTVLGLWTLHYLGWF